MTWRRCTLRPGDTRCRVYKKCVRFFFSFHPLISPFLCLRTRGLWFAVLTLLIPFVSSFHLILGQRGLLATYLPSISPYYGYTATLEYRKAILCCKHTTHVLTRSPGDPAAAELQGTEQPLPGAGQGSVGWGHGSAGTAKVAQRRAELCCARQCCAMQHGDAPGWAVLCQAVPSCPVPGSTMPCSMEMCCARLC